MSKGSGFEASAILRKFALSVAVCLGIIAAPPAIAACTNPPGEEGDQFYNAAHQTMQFCDGTDWWSMKGNQVTLPSCAVGDGIVMTSAGYWSCSPGGPP